MGEIAPEVQAKLELWGPRQRMPDWPDWYRWDGGWYENDGEHAYYVVWDELKVGGVVLDIGAYEGKWAVVMAEKYPACVYHCFEPAPRAFKVMQGKFGNQQNVHLYNYGLGAKTRACKLYDPLRDSASFIEFGKYGQDKGCVEARIVDIAGFWQEQKLERVALAEVNIEGGEFELLPHMLELGLVEKVERWMIQWHSVVENGPARQLEIQSALAKTHEMTWNLGAWEAWRLRSLPSVSVAEPLTVCTPDTC